MEYRDRDAPVTHDGLVFRTYGYNHPQGSCFCDLEYAPESLYTTADPRTIREGPQGRYYKFYFDGGLKFASNSNPPYTIHHRPLDREMVGVRDEQLAWVVRPDERLKSLMDSGGDPLIEACVEVVDLVTSTSTLSPSDLGVFGSLAHGFHHPGYSDIDLIVYGEKEMGELREALGELYREGDLRNEFDSWTPAYPPAHWNFIHLAKSEYGALQRRKAIYAVYNSGGLGREVKVEFEPVRRWDEIENEYRKTQRITDLGRVEAIGEVLSVSEGGFMPSVYPVRLEELKAGIDCGEVRRIVSYVEEFRLQLEPGERAFIRGNLERVERDGSDFYQMSLSYREDYFDQVLKPCRLLS
ncbi:MAG: nucleotidyltransferase domain-containing protein [Candidatus Bathyarchaeota archaeon]